MSAPATTAAAAAPAAAPAPSWQEQLRAKRRRRIVLPIQVSDDDGGLAAEVARLRGTRDVLREIPTTEAASLLPQAEAALATAETALSEHTVDVAFQSLPAADYEALTALHPGPEEAGGIDWRSCLPALAAACCAEEDSADQSWWAETLAMDCWTPADLLTLWTNLLRLHARAPSARVPFA